MALSDSQEKCKTRSRGISGRTQQQLPTLHQTRKLNNGCSRHKDQLAELLKEKHTKCLGHTKPSKTIRFKIPQRSKERQTHKVQQGGSQMEAFTKPPVQQGRPLW